MKYSVLRTDAIILLTHTQAGEAAGVNVSRQRMSESIDPVTEMESCLPSQWLTQICIYTGDEMRY